MKILKKHTLIVLSILLFLSSVPSVASTSLGRHVQKDMAAPDFSLRTANGKTVVLKDMKGKNVLLFFFATWCPWCRKKIPELTKSVARYKKDDIEVLLIDVGESKTKVSSFAAKQKLPLDILLDQDMKVADDYQVVGVPTYVLISKDGRILSSGNEMPSNYRKLISRQ